MTNKVIVYGLGHDFEMDFDKIHDFYEVIGYSDRNNEKAKKYGKKQIERERLKDYLSLCDYVLITASMDRMDIMHDLILNCGIPENKIWFFRHLGAASINESLEYVEPTFYGQFYDDGVFWGLFSNLGYKLRNIKYLEIGTNDPVLSNNTYFFYKHGARGTLVDPLHTSEVMCKKMRPEDDFIRAAVSSTSGEDVTLFVGVAAQGTSMHEKYAPMDHMEIKAPKIGIVDLFEKIGYVPDLLVVDAEGEDENIIRAIDYIKYCPKIIEFEINKVDSYKESIIEFLKNKGYELFSFIGSNAIFVQEPILKRIKFNKGKFIQ